MEPLPLDDPDKCKAWFLIFEVHCITKNLKDDTTPSPVTDKFLEKCGSKTLLKIVSLLPGKEIDKLKYSDLKKLVVEYIEPRKRLVIADRTNFLSLLQSKSESEVFFLHASMMLVFISNGAPSYVARSLKNWYDFAS